MPGIRHLSNAAYARHQDWDDNVTGPLGKALRDLQDVVNEAQCENLVLPGDREETSDIIASLSEGLSELVAALACLDEASPNESPEDDDTDGLEF